MANKNIARLVRRKKRVSTNMHGTKTRPRIAVFRSNKYVYAQAIDDDAARTLATANSREMKSKEKATKTETATTVGKVLAEKLLKIKIKQAIYDRSRFAYKGRVKALAEGLRQGGITI